MMQENKKKWSDKKMEHIVIGIEGLVGSGKTSICRELLNRIPDSILFQGGNLYRGIVYAVMQRQKEKIEDVAVLQKSFSHIDIKKVMDILKVQLKIENRETVIYIDGQKIDEEELQSKENSMLVSVAGGAADNTHLFEFARTLINEMKKQYNLIVSGRALMEIYPDLDYHFLVTASLEERVNRKSKQYGYTTKEEKEALKAHIIKRDALQQQAGFYKKYDKTIIVDVTDCKNVESSTNKLETYIEEIPILA